MEIIPIIKLRSSEVSLAHLFISHEINEIMKNKIYEWPRALFSAHLHHFLPHIPWGQHENIYELFEEYHKPKMQRLIQIENNTSREFILNIEPNIFCLYHLGLHYETVLSLGEMGINFDLLLDRDVYEQNNKIFLNIHSNLKKNGLEYKFLFSDDPTVLLKIRTTLKEARHLLVFVDGNSGASENANHLVKVDFLNGSLNVRQGITMISHLLGVCMLPLIIENKDDKFIIILGDVINPKHWENRSNYIKEGTQLLYDYLASQIKSEPWKWECWRYIHENGSFNPGKANLKDKRIPIRFEEENEAIVPVILQNRRVNFNRANYMLFL